MKRLIKLILGWAFVALGIVGLVLPILQGLLFIAIGFAILSQESEWARRQVEKLRHRYPRLSDEFDTAADKASAMFKRVANRRSE